ncbi:MAG TPA: AAA domain-containing protein [Noviherbaspirillum sp.]
MTVSPSEATEPSNLLSSDGISGFAKRVLRYFQDFIETDFKRHQAPRRRIILKNDAGFRMGIPLRKYSTLFETVWKASREPLAKPFELRIPKSRFMAPLSATLRDLIAKQVAAIPDESFSTIRENTIDYAKKKRITGAQDAEKFADDVSVLFVEDVGQRLIVRLLSTLEEPFKQNAYSSIESVYDIEADLTEAITKPVTDRIAKTLNTLIVSNDDAELKALLNEFFATADVRQSLTEFFEQFSTADIFQELRDLDNTLRTAEGQSLYLYLCDIKFGTASFPLFYVPLEILFDDQTTSFVLKADPHLYINKRALDWIVQELVQSTGRTFISPVEDRILYLSGTESFADAAAKQLKSMVKSLEVAADLDLSGNRLKVTEGATVRMSNSVYFAVFDKADESILSDYEALLTAIEGEEAAAANMFENIVRSMILEEPHNATTAIDQAWDAIQTPDRLIAPSPIPVNEEQRKIQLALNAKNCNYVVVQGPPGTGKSHTISAIAFDAILSGKSILILSDKQEALDVVEDKLAATLAKVRHGGDDFPNPILRLGKTSSYPKLIASSSLERIKEQDRAQRANAARLDNETKEVHESLRAKVAITISAYSSIKLDEIHELSRLEREIEQKLPGFTERLRDAIDNAQLSQLETALKLVTVDQIKEVAHALQGTGLSATGVQAELRVLLAANKLAGARHASLGLFSELAPSHIPVLSNFIVEYENAKWPVFGFMFCRGKARAIDQQLGTTLPCVNALDLHKNIDALRQVVSTLSAIQRTANECQVPDTHMTLVYKLLATNKSVPSTTQQTEALISAFLAALPDHWPQLSGANASQILQIIHASASYALDWHRISHTVNSAPVFDYVGEKSRLETLHAARMSREIDSKFVNFVQENRALAKSIGEVIKSKKQFPTNEFDRFAGAFPCIIAGIRDYASYVPLKSQCFDIVVIDEASQVSLAQAFPALLRAKRVVVFGDEKQFSNVKSQQASRERNATYLTDMESFFRRHISSAADRIERLKQFDVKKSVLDFFKLVANTEIMLKKHFRGYQELISFSSEQFYDGQLQAIKVRAKQMTDVIAFKVLEHDGRTEKHRNSNSVEAEYILNELRRMIDEDAEESVGIITPFREQQEALSRLLMNDTYADQFQKQLKLKIMTFDTCQGEERDLIIYSMVATRDHDALNYVFPVSLEDTRERIEEALKVQRLNVGFSRAKEAMLFVLSKPVTEFKGSIGRAIKHFESVLSRRSMPTGGPTESPMEAKVLDWIQKTAFFQKNADVIELQTQFRIGDYLRQLDPSYKDPAYRADFLLTYYGDPDTEADDVRIIIEYDGFAEHFVNREQVTNSNWEHFYKESDIERQLVIESYGYKFLRINRFNLGKDPIQTLSERLYQLVNQAVESAPLESVSKILVDTEDLQNGKSKPCPKCARILDLSAYYDPSLRNGTGGHGRICMSCKAPEKATTPFRKSRRRFARRWG